MLRNEIYLSDEIISHLPVVTAGHTELILKYEANEYNDSWDNHLFLEALKRVNPEVLPALLEVRWSWKDLMAALGGGGGGGAAVGALVGGGIGAVCGTILGPLGIEVGGVVGAAVGAGIGAGVGGAGGAGIGFFTYQLIKTKPILKVRYKEWQMKRKRKKKNRNKLKPLSSVTTSCSSSSHV